MWATITPCVGYAAAHTAGSRACCEGAVVGGAIFGVELWKSAAIADVVSASKVTESLLRSWSEDGTLTKEEVAQAFGKAK